ncbi:MAG: SurA N-terminal domain-containing protein, partial [Candidatus Krumholzibacteria bacterium]|nr:SurA N-terminal domain-containing protein [Candidatus Krumholzibacteria bacterium]
MLKQLRERTKTILWIVVVAFVVSIFAVWGMNLRTGGPERTQNSDVAGSVDGETIYRRAYMNTLNEIYNQMTMQKGEDYTPTASEHQMLSEQAWE